MYNLKVNLRCLDGSILEADDKVDILSKNSVSAVHINASSKKTLDPDFGAEIVIQIDGVESWMADFRHSEFWCMPAFGKSLASVPDETQGLIYKKINGVFGVILPVVSEQYKCVLKGAKDGFLSAKLFSWYDGLNDCNAIAFVCAEGANPYELLEKCADYGLRLLGTGCRTRSERVYPEFFEYLGWCSWDSMEIRVNESDLIKKCAEFKEKNIPVRWAIIDDMWAEVHDFYNAKYDNRPEMFKLMHSSRLYSFKADPKRFPNGLDGCIKKMNDHGIRVGMWHPTTGYWMGIDPESELFQTLKECLIKTKDGRYIHSYQQDKAYFFYSTFHDYLKKCGVEFVKIDNQTMTRRFYKNLAPVGEVAREFHNAIEDSAKKYFESKMINCMGMGSEDMWNRSISSISRCSDDFLPENSAWFTKHILQCSYNDLIQGQFYYCDWDMWWTDDGQAVKNSILRAMSGGPIYVSDMLDRSNAEVLLPLTLSDGKILRCDRPAVPAIDCLTSDPTISGKIFKLQNICGESGIIAAFNLDGNDNTVNGTVSPCEIHGLFGDEFAVYEHFSGKLDILKYSETLSLTLKDKNDFRLYVIVPIKDGFAAIGRTDKFISPKTIKSVSGREVELFEDGKYAVCENGKLIIKN